MLTLFIVPSAKDNADVGKTVDSFRKTGVEFKAVTVSCWREINNYRHKGEWFAIFWDNEGLDADLQATLKIHLENTKPEILVLYKRLSELEAEFRTRFMKRKIWLSTDFKPICAWCISEVILDGWVTEHDKDQVRLVSV